MCTLRMLHIGNASINNDTMVAVIVRALQCGVQYTITAGGMFDNGTLVGPAMSHDSTVTSPCPPATGENFVVELLRTIKFLIAVFYQLITTVL